MKKITDRLKRIVHEKIQLILGENECFSQRWINGSRAVLTHVKTNEICRDVTVVSSSMGNPDAPKTGDVVALEFDDELNEEHIYEWHGIHWYEIDNSFSNDPVQITQC